MQPKFSMKRFEDLTESKHPEPEYAGTVLRIVGRDLGAEHLAMSMTILKPGQKIPVHSHPTAEEIHLIMKGKSTVIIEGERVGAEAITAFRFPPGSNYGLTNDSKEDATWIFVGAPIDEYLEVYRKKFGSSSGNQSKL
jgi:quercetin dioxygenase-like cupin family protein